ncbi:MFS transporter [Porticoccaceae bacterium]|nr:MFS transporter [Porticoccaceae bacterium]
MTSSISNVVNKVPLSGQTLTLKHQILYVLPSLGMVYFGIAVSVVQGVYAKHFGMSLSTIATILLISRLFDVVTDPVVGYLSDRFHARTGSRKIFIAIGGLSIIFSGYFLLVPVDPSSVNDATQVSGLYFAICYLAFYLSLTLFVIPHSAWGSELAKTGKEKSSLFALLALSNYIGAALFFSVPLLPWFETSEITPQSLQWTALGSVLFILPSLYFSLKRVPDVPATNLSHGLQASERSTLRTQASVLLSMVLDNKPLLLFLLGSLFFGLALGIYVSLNFIFIDSYLGMGKDYAMLSLMILVVAAAGLRCWHWVVLRWGMRLAWSLGGVITAMGMLAFLALRPDETSFIQLFVVTAIVSFGMGSANMIPLAMLSEIVDYSVWKYRMDCTGSLFSLYPLVSKFNFAIGGSIGFFVASWYGFEVTSETHSYDSAFGLYLAMSWLPAILILISTVFIYLMPINARRHKIVRRRLDAREL